VSDLLGSLGWGLAVAISLVAGALAAAFIVVPERVAATLTAFGGGTLLAAVALELLPEADAQAGVWLTASGLLAGTALYVGADAWLTRDPGMRSTRRARHAAVAGMKMPLPPEHDQEAARGEAIAAGLFVDGVPESVALGLTVAQGRGGMALLVGILVGNAVEAYGSAHPIVDGGHSKGFAIGLLTGIGAALALATILGGTLLVDSSPALIGTMEAFAAGAVLAVISVSVIPYAFSEVNSRVALASVLGFVVGYLLS
jgi:ZIP family zinc transporter